MLNAEELADLICKECGVSRTHKTKTILDKLEMLSLYAFIRKLKLEAEQARKESIVETAKEIALEVFNQKP